MTEIEFLISKYKYHEDGYLISIKTNKQVGRPNDEGYIRVRGTNGKEYRAHRIIWMLHFGEIPEGMLIDHIDGNKQNNKINNLRLATRIQNNANSIARVKTSGLPKGVVKTGNTYRARLTHKGKTYSLGSYLTIEEAKNAYDKKALEIHGEFAKIV